jgi:hypothetical protein
MASTHPDRRPTINNDGLPGHALRFAISDDQLGNVIRASGTSKNGLGARLLLHFLGQPPRHPRSLHQSWSWRYAIHGHVRCQCDCQAVGEMDLAALLAAYAILLPPGAIPASEAILMIRPIP